MRINKQTAEEAVVEDMKAAVDDNGATGTVDQPETSETSRPLEGMEDAPEPTMDEDGQTSIPGTESEEEPEKDPKEPRSKGDIAADFRMAMFYGDVKSITEDWDKGRSLKMIISSTDRARLQNGMNKFSAADDLMFRVLSRRPMLGNKEPEDFGSKIPNFGVEMVERLERKSCEGFSGWQSMDRDDICFKMKEIFNDLDETVLAADDGVDENDAELEEGILKRSVDLANFAFFMWWNTRNANHCKKEDA